MRFPRRYSWSNSRRDRLAAKLSKRAPSLVVGIVLALLLFVLAWIVALAFKVDWASGVGFLVAAIGLCLTLITRNSSSLWVWGASVGLSTIGLLIAVLSLPGDCGPDCLARFV